MLFKMVTKWWPLMIIAAFLILLIGMFLSISDTDNRGEDTLQRTSKISDNMWLYVTKSQSDSATTPTLYHYYVAGEKSGSDKQIVQYLAEGFPFLSGTGTISEIRAETDNRVYVTYSGRVFSLSNEASYEDNGQQVSVNFSYRIN